MTFADLINCACLEFEISREELISKSRKQNCADARAAIMYLSDKYNIEYGSIAAEKLGRTRCSFYSARQKVPALMESDPIFVRKMIQIIETIERNQ